MPFRKMAADQGGVDLGIIITPMLDMAFQLLAFFIMTYNPPAREAIVDGMLLPPSQALTKGTPTKSKDKPKLDTKDPVTKIGIHVIVRATPPGTKGQTVGQPREIAIQKFGDLQPQRIAGIGSKVEADFGAALRLLEAELAKARANPAERDLPVSIEADRWLKYGYFLRVQDVVSAAGFKKIGYNEPP